MVVGGEDGGRGEGIEKKVVKEHFEYNEHSEHIGIVEIYQGEFLFLHNQFYLIFVSCLLVPILHIGTSLLLINSQLNLAQICLVILGIYI